MPKPHALKRLSNVDAVIRQAPSKAAAARALNVDASTIHRYLKRGVSQEPVRKRPRRKTGRTVHRLSARGWGAWVRRTYDLNQTEDGYVTLAVNFRRVAEDKDVPLRQRLAASREYRTLVAALNLEDPDGEVEETQPEAPARRWPSAVE
jgi:hypothetical protein